MTLQLKINHIFSHYHFKKLETQIYSSINEILCRFSILLCFTFLFHSLVNSYICVNEYKKTIFNTLLHFSNHEFQNKNLVIYFYVGEFKGLILSSLTLLYLTISDSNIISSSSLIKHRMSNPIIKFIREAAKKVLFLVAGPLRGGGG